MTDLGTLGGASCDVKDINNHGQIVGGSTPADTPSEYDAHTFLWEMGTMIDLTPDQGPYEGSCATALNELGQVIGALTRSCFNTYDSVLWSNGTAIDLSFGRQGFTRLDAINDHGQVVGYGKTEGSGCGPGMPYCTHHSALLWENGVLTDLGIDDGRWGNDPVLLNNRGQIVMDPYMGCGEYPYLWQNGVLTQFASPGKATAINDEGLVAGYYERALLWKIEPAAPQD
jgi:probable HAF family extracellular repeat protein